MPRNHDDIYVTCRRDMPHFGLRGRGICVIDFRKRKVKREAGVHSQAQVVRKLKIRIRAGTNPSQLKLKAEKLAVLPVVTAERRVDCAR